MDNRVFKKIIKQRNISLTELSKLSSVSYETLKSIYYGRVSNPRIDTLIKICNALKINVYELLNEVSPNEKQLYLNYHKCGKHGKAIIEKLAMNQAMAVDNHDRYKTIYCVVPHSIIDDGILDATSTYEKIQTGSSRAFIGYMFTTNNFMNYNFCAGDIILLENRVANIGEMAVFSNGRISYFRILDRENDNYVLKPMNSKGKPIYLKRLDEYNCVGTCIDVIRK